MIKIKFSESQYIIIMLGSDISVVDMHSFSLKMNGIDTDSLSGCFVSETEMVKLDSLTDIN